MNRPTLIRLILAFILAPIVPGVILALLFSDWEFVISSVQVGVPASFVLGVPAYALARRRGAVGPAACMLGGAACGGVLAALMGLALYVTWPAGAQGLGGPMMFLLLLFLVGPPLGMLAGLVFWLCIRR